jgi:nucleoid-associated protein YgaU
MNNPSPTSCKPHSLRNLTGKALLPVAVLLAGLSVQPRDLAAEEAAVMPEPSVAVPVADLQAALENFREQLTAEQAARARVEASLATAGTERDRLGEALSQTEVRLQRAEQSLSETTGEREGLAEQLTAEQAARTRVEASLATAGAERDRLGEALSQTEARLQQAEQSLSAVTGEKDALAKQLAEEQAARRKIEEALSAVTAEREGVREALSQTKAGLGQAEERLSAVEAERKELNSTLGQYRATLGETKQNLAEVVAERDRRGAQLQQLQREQESMRATLKQSRAAEEGLLRDIAQLQARLPETLGGTASLESLRAAAGELAGELRTIHRALRRAPGDAELLQRRKVTAAALRERQLLIAGATGASGVYRLRPEDTLMMVAARVYGSGSRWPEIYRANDHVLEDPDRLIPELTLVLP